ncbi:glycosyltransferase family A protein [Lactobacillus sp. LL6]|uniref:glycosyltransferase family 2 protein n=1 Tax=Lactobacillus sp. LL6 TaxID=2596827 RepID=UPI0011850A65|nr:glycosyltransferase family A protein [Lactobacillus sp. LL6]TSO25632.1 glycosyltransferase family 2 protein [Lactobacillus sp. LL6]
MQEQPELTVIMPVYNMEKYLSKALDHLANQTDSNFKLLIVNDGSKDKTASVAESYRNKFRHMKIINKANGGLSDARNVGMENVDTPYFTFHDGDDWVEPGYTDFFVRAFHNHPNVAMVSCGYFIDSPHRQNHVVGSPAEGELSKVRTYGKMTNIFNSTVKGYTWNKGYKTAVVRKFGLEFVEGLAFMEDQIFNVKYISETDGFYFNAVPLYHYWQRDDSMVHKFNFKMVPDNIKANYIVWKQILKSLIRGKKVQKNQSSSKLISEGNNNERKS